MAGNVGEARSGMKEREEDSMHQKEEKRTYAMRIMEALSGVDEELLERSEGGAGKAAGKIHKKIWQYGRAWAAVLCLAIVGAVSLGGYQLTQRVGEGGSGNAAEDSTIKLEGVEICPEEGEAGAAGGADGGIVSGAEEQENINTDQYSQKDGGMENGEISPEEGAAGNGNAGTEEMVRESQAAEEGQSDALPISENMVEGYESVDMGCPSVQLEKFKETEARKQELLGDYIPTALPSGYLFEDAYRDQDREDVNLTVIWTRGMDSVTWNITVPEELPETVDVNRPETYDQRLYEIPYAETVPEEYRESMNDPVFDREDFSLEIVKSRIVSRSDAGDTDTPRGNFGVLYSDGVLVYFNGRGTVEEIWEMFCSLENER